nr:WRKY transcription factor 69 [Manihot esculenta]
MAEDWDLYAVVRSCTTSATNTAATANAEVSGQNANFENHLCCLASLTFEADEPFSFPDLEKPRNDGLQELQDSYKAFLPITTVQGNIPTSSISDFGGFIGQNQSQLAQQQQQLHHPPPHGNIPFGLRFNHRQPQPQHARQQPNQRQQLHQLGSQRPETSPSFLPLRATQSSASRSRKKKSHQKRQVMHVTAENLSNDVWAWRKYGQKPIKGSPYPRNYYRCSSSKGCAARKQVERSNTDPNMFIVSYTGEHTHPRPTHRNSLAGSTRNKFSAIQKPANKESEEPSAEKAPCSSPLSATSLSPTTPLSAPMDHETANENINTEAAKMDGADLESHGMDSDGEYYEDDDDILIPNMTFNEDLIKDLQELGTVGDGSFGIGSNSSGGLGQTPDFGDNFFSWSVGSSAGGGGD